MRKLGVVALLLAALVLGTGHAHAATVTLVVDDDRVQCPDADFTRIQDAVDAAPAGTRIEVCPGTYAEQVVVPAGKDGLDIYSQTPLAAVIQAPPVMLPPKAIVRIAGARNVAVRQFTITGPGPGACDSLEYGVRVDTGGSAAIASNHITEIRDEPFGGCQNGIAVQVGRRFEGQTGQAAILANTIDRYQKGGVVVDNAGSYALVGGNGIAGIGPTPITAQNGVQISRGATALVTGNRVVDNAYSLANLGVFSATGILLYQAGAGTVVDRNAASRNDDNLGAYTTSRSRISSNRFTDSTFYDGIFMDVDTAANTIRDNVLRGNAEHDCHDDSVGPGTAGTANFWTGNDGVTQNRPGLCRPGRDDGHGHGHHGGGEDD